MTLRVTVSPLSLDQAEAAEGPHTHVSSRALLTFLAAGVFRTLRGGGLSALIKSPSNQKGVFRAVPPHSCVVVGAMGTL